MINWNKIIYSNEGSAAGCACYSSSEGVGSKPENPVTIGGYVANENQESVEDGENDENS